MQALATILDSLGIDRSLFFQLALCMLLYWLLARYVLSGFFAAHQKREQQTTGNEGVVNKLNQQHEQAANEYQKLARDLNTQSQQIFNAQQQKTQKECARILNAAKTKAQQQIEQGQLKLNQQAQTAQSQLNKEAGALAHSIVQKLRQPARPS